MQDADAVLTDRLLRGERIAWSGRPVQGLLLTARDAFLIPFSVLWLGFAVFWTVVASRAGAFALFGLIFVAVGLFVMVGRFVADAWLRQRTVYAVTDRRVLILRTPPFSDFTALALDRLVDVGLSERADGNGTVRFGPRTTMLNNRFSSWMPALDPTPQFLAISGARAVFDLVQKRDTR